MQGMHASSSGTSLASLTGFSPRESAESEVLRGDGSVHAPLSAVYEQPDAEGGAENSTIIAGAPPGGMTEEELMFYNPMTHFITGEIGLILHLDMSDAVRGCLISHNLGCQSDLCIYSRRKRKGARGCWA